MNRLFIISVISLFVTGVSFGQADNEIPHLEMNPDHFILTEKVIDSIIQYAYSSPGDSTLLHKWEYLHKDNNVHESVRYFWRTDLGEWSAPRNKYVFRFDNNGTLLLIEHYNYLYTNGVWKGCDSEGCGKREWVYDTNDSLLLKSQYYWNNASRGWDLYVKWENIYDLEGNLVMKSYKNKEENYSGWGWDGEKDEYSYDNNGNITGHVHYRWGGGDPYDWVPLNKAEWQYNSFNQLGNYAVYQWESGRWIGIFDEWNTCYRAENLYDSVGNKTSVNLYKWDYDKDNWVINYSEPVLYNSNGQIISGLGLVFYIYDYIGDVEVQRNEFTYDTDGYLICQVNYSFNEYFASWPNPAGIDTILFNSEGLIISEISSHLTINWPSEEPYWNSTKYEYDYDIMGNTIMYVRYNWEPELNIWVGSRKEEFDFDDRGNEVLYVSFGWNTETNDWFNYRKNTNQFDTSGNNISERTFVWNTVRNDWDGITRRDREFDNNGRLTMIAQYGWDDNLSDWRGVGEDGKMSWTYSPQGILKGETSYIWDTIQNGWQYKIWLDQILDEDGDPLSFSQSSWNPDSNMWEPVIKNYFYYKNNTTSRNVIEANHISIYPNPSSDIINIYGLTQPEEIKIFSIQGNLVKYEHQATNWIDISDLPSGIYILNLTSGSTVLKRTIIKK